MKTLIVIPARYASTRFPGKPLALLGGETVISRVWHRARLVPGVDVVVATDDSRIFDHVVAIGGEGAAMMTATTHQSGTDRCGEVLQRLEEQQRHYDVVVNVQGDEPFLDPAQIGLLVDCFENPDVEIATLATPVGSMDELLSPNNVKVVLTDDDFAMYFSRHAIPFCRGVEQAEWLSKAPYFKHVGVYAYRDDVLREVCRLRPSTLERCEKLEQLRWLGAGYRIKVCKTDHANIGIDTPDDLAEAERRLAGEACCEKGELTTKKNEVL